MRIPIGQLLEKALGISGIRSKAELLKRAKEIGAMGDNSDISFSTINAKLKALGPNPDKTNYGDLVIEGLKNASKE